MVPLAGLVRSQAGCHRSSGSQPIGNFTRRRFKLRFCIFCGFLELFESFAVFRKSPQNLWIVFKQRSESPQISAILRKTCAKHAETTTQKNTRKISQCRALCREAVRIATHFRTWSVPAALSAHRCAAGLLLALLGANREVEERPVADVVVTDRLTQRARGTMSN